MTGTFKSDMGLAIGSIGDLPHPSCADARIAWPRQSTGWNRSLEEGMSVGTLDRVLTLANHMRRHF
jgi:hypothetical protein